MAANSRPAYGEAPAALPASGRTARWLDAQDRGAEEAAHDQDSPSTAEMSEIGAKRNIELSAGPSRDRRSHVDHLHLATHSSRLADQLVQAILPLRLRGRAKSGALGWLDVGIVVNGDLYGPFLLKRAWVVCWLLIFAAMLALRPDWRGEFVGQLRAARTIYRRS